MSMRSRRSTPGPRVGREVRLRLEGDRAALRRALLERFIDEVPGTGPGKGISRYRYDVDHSASGHTIWLYRPAHRNKGLDFTVRVPSVRFNAKSRQWPHIPSHQDLIDILTLFKRTFPAEYATLAAALRAVYAGTVPRHLARLARMRVHPVRGDAAGCPADLIVAVARWLFVEQDLTYWNHSGRKMLFDWLERESLV